MLTSIAIGLLVAFSRTAFLIGIVILSQYKITSWELSLRTWKGRVAYTAVVTLSMSVYVLVATSILPITIGPLYICTYFIGMLGTLLIFPHTRFGKQVHYTYQLRRGTNIIASYRKEWSDAWQKAQASRRT